MSPERRRYRRSEVRLEAIQHAGGRRVARTVTNIGSGGCFVEGLGGTAAPGGIVVLEFASPEGSFRVTAEVVYVDQRGAGVRVTRADWDRLAALAARP